NARHLGGMDDLGHCLAELLGRSDVVGGMEPLGPRRVSSGSDQRYLVASGYERIYQISDHGLDPAVRRRWNVEVGRCDHRDVDLLRPDRSRLGSGKGRACGAHSERLLASRMTGAARAPVGHPVRPKMIMPADCGANAASALIKSQ